MGGRLSSMGGRLSSIGGRHTSIGGRHTSIGGRRSSMGGRLSSRYFFCSNYFSNNTYLMFIEFTVNQCFSVLLLIITMIYFDDVIVEYNINIKDFFSFFLIKGSTRYYTFLVGT